MLVFESLDDVVEIVNTVCGKYINFQALHQTDTKRKHN